MCEGLPSLNPVAHQNRNGLCPLLMDLIQSVSSTVALGFLFVSWHLAPFQISLLFFDADPNFSLQPRPSLIFLIK